MFVRTRGCFEKKLKSSIRWRHLGVPGLILFNVHCRFSWNTFLWCKLEDLITIFGENIFFIPFPETSWNLSTQKKKEKGFEPFFRHKPKYLMSLKLSSSFSSFDNLFLDFVWMVSHSLLCHLVWQDNSIDGSDPIRFETANCIDNYPNLQRWMQNEPRPKTIWGTASIEMVKTCSHLWHCS